MTALVGVSGGIGSGKSTVSRLFGDCGAVVLDADEAARTATSNSQVLRALEDRFGAEILDSDGSLDREKLGMAVFAGSDAKISLENRRALEAIVHPVVRKVLDQQIKQARQDEVEVIVLDIPLLHESKYLEICDLLVFVRSPQVDRLRRCAERGWDAGELQRRESVQTPIEDKKQHSHKIIENDGDLNRLREQVQALYDDLMDH